MLYTFGDHYTLDPVGYELREHGRLVRLEPQVFDVLAYLVQHPDRTVTKEELLAQLWPQPFVADDALTQCVARVRKALGDTGQTQRYIQTVRRRGYRFIAPVTVRTLAATDAPSPPPDPPGPAGGARQDAAERRQLTILCCDLVESPVLARQLDPEDWRAVVHAYHVACAEVIQGRAGHIAQYLGDGLLVYFGYPQAQEDDAQRAVRTGLGLVAAMRPLNAGLEPTYGIRLAVQVGIHTGLAVVGVLGEGERQEQLALGETPHIAARLQALAAPDTVVISAATAQLVAGYFVCQSRGAQALPGGAQPLQVSRVLRESGAQTRLDVVPPRGLTPLVGRDDEVALLQRRWAQATRGQGQVVLLSGEPGIGKSRLVQVLTAHVAAEAHLRIEWRGSPSHQQSAFSPVIAQLQRRLRWSPAMPPAVTLRTLEATLTASGVVVAEAVPLLAALLSLPLPAAYPPLTLTPQQQRQRTFETLLAWLDADARRQPVLVVVEDVHWLDPSTLELLSLLMEQVTQRRLCLLLTARPEFHPPWAMVAHLTVLLLRRLAPAQVAEIATHVAGAQAFPAVLQEVVRKTEGVPLFVEEVTKMVLESGLLAAHADRSTRHGPLPPLTIPATLHDALTARLDRLGPAKQVAQLGATLGRSFAYDLLYAVSPWEETALQHGLRQLVEAGLVTPRGVPPQATYQFKHALIQDAAYQALLKRTRRQYHQQIAQVLEAQFPETAETQPELLAHHWTEAGLIAQAVGYWQRAGQRAVARSANVEAVSHCTRGLAVLQHLPDGPARLQQELELQTALGPAFMATKGFAALEVEQVYARARTLCQHIGDTPQRFPVLWGSWLSAFARAELQSARALGEQLLTLAARLQDPVLLLGAHQALGQTLSHQGALTLARAHLEQGLVRDTPQPQRSRVFLYGQEPSVACLASAAFTLWALGYPSQAREHSHRMLTLARELSHPFTLASALLYAAQFPGVLREGAVVQALAEEALALCREQGFGLGLARGTIVRGWAVAAQGQREEGLAQMHQGLVAFRGTGARAGLPLYLALLAEVYGGAGRPTEGLRLLAEALAVMQQHGLHYYEASLHWLKGALLLVRSTDPATETEHCFRQALTVARRQEAKSLELRAAMSLSRLWQQQGKHTEAQALLAPIYDWFTEGFDTADLKEAKALLEEFAR